LITHTDSGAGEDAVDWLLELLDEADKVNPINGRRFTAEHLLPGRKKEALEKVKRLGMIISASDLVCYFAAARSLKMSGVMDRVKISKLQKEDPRARTAREWGLPLRDWLDMGIVVTCGTDCPAVPYDPDHPFLGFYSVVTGETLAGILLPGQHVTREEAMRMHTINNAYSTFEENIKGSIESGKLADFTVYTDDIMTVPDEKIKDLRVAMTIVDGEVVYER
jgi:predicted amidohydrolase YtcJ